jgi:hypothetical protein
MRLMPFYISKKVVWESGFLYKMAEAEQEWYGSEGGFYVQDRFPVPMQSHHSPDGLPEHHALALKDAL